VTGVSGVEVLCTATALDPHYKTLRCLSPEEEDHTWMAIEEKLSVAVASDAHTVILQSAILKMFPTLFVNQGTNTSD